MIHSKLTGLVAATFTPFHADGRVNLDPIPAYVEYLISKGIQGMYVCGSTGEGVSLSAQERREVTEAYVKAAAGRLPVIVQVGHNSLQESKELAAHAQEVGADMISSNSPSYFKPGSVEELVGSMAELASGAPELPFYYYHIPALTGVPLDMVEFLRQGEQAIPTLVGIKFSDIFVPDFQSCFCHADGKFDILWGCDEMLLSGVVVGAAGAVGSTYSIAAPVYDEIFRAFAAGEMEAAREAMFTSVRMVKLLLKYGRATVCMKEAILPLLGFDFGPSRLPLRKMTPQAVEELQAAWKAEGFLDAAHRYPAG
jgi:N-acetylneuraminate lyase